MRLRGVWRRGTAPDPGDRRSLANWNFSGQANENVSWMTHRPDGPAGSFMQQNSYLPMFRVPRRPLSASNYACRPLSASKYACAVALVPPGSAKTAMVVSLCRPVARAGRAALLFGDFGPSTRGGPLVRTRNRQVVKSTCHPAVAASSLRSAPLCSVRALAYAATTAAVALAAADAATADNATRKAAVGEEGRRPGTDDAGVGVSGWRGPDLATGSHITIAVSVAKRKTHACRSAAVQQCRHCAASAERPAQRKYLPQCRAVSAGLCVLIKHGRPVAGRI